MGVQHNIVASPPRGGDMTGEVLAKVGCPGAALPCSASNSEGPPAAGKLVQRGGRAASGCSVDSGTTAAAAADGDASCSAFGGAVSLSAATANAAGERRTATEEERAAAAASLCSPSGQHRQQHSTPPPPLLPNYMGTLEQFVSGLGQLDAAADVSSGGGCGEVPAAEAARSSLSACFAVRASTAPAGDGVRENGATEHVPLPELPEFESLRVSRSRSLGGGSRVDASAARRLARRLYNLEGFKRSDVVKHLSKSNDFARLVADEYLQHFDFSGLTLVEAMRAFFGLHPLPFSAAESPDQQCVAAHVARRYSACNVGFLPASQSEDECRTLACAILLLNANLHSQNAGKKISLSEFVKDVQSLHCGYVYSEPLLSSIYSDMQLEALSHAEPSEDTEQPSGSFAKIDHVTSHVPPGVMETAADYTNGAKHSARMEITLMQMIKLSASFEYKRGYVRRKCCKGTNGNKFPFGKRSWKTFFAVLRGTSLRLADSEPAYDRDAVKVCVSVDNALASVAADYKKSGCFLRLETADGSEYLLQTGDTVDLEDWVEVINLVAASMSCSAEPPSAPLDFGSPRSAHRVASKRLAIGSSGSLVGSRAHAPSPPQLPGGVTLDGSTIGLDLRSRMKEHDWRIAELVHELAERGCAEQSSPAAAAASDRRLQASKSAAAQTEERRLLFELKRRRIYSELLKKKLAEFPELDTSFEITAIGECDEPPLSPRSVTGPTGISPWGGSFGP